MSKYLYKEKKHAEEIIENGFTSKYIATELKILAKYQKTLNKEEQDIKDFLYDFCKKKFNGFNKAVHFKIINNALSHAMNEKNKLIEIESIPIRKFEIDYIDGLDIDHNFKRVVFTLLVMNRLGKRFIEIKEGENTNKDFYFGGHKSFINLTKFSKVTFIKSRVSKIRNIHDIIRELSEKEIVSIVGNGKIKLLFMYDLEKNKDLNDDILLEVKDFQVIGHYYDLYHGVGKIKMCERCENPIQAKNNRMKYCESCWKERERELRKVINKRYYEKKIKTVSGDTKTP